MTFLGETSEAERNHMSLNAMFVQDHICGSMTFLVSDQTPLSKCNQEGDIRESPKDNSYSPYSFVAFQHESTDR